MCGITGVVLAEATSDRDFLVAMRDALKHRGPDDAGTWWSDDGLVGLAHRRLSIIDLSPNGHQPMLDSRRELVLTFNGEIYNYQQLRAELVRLGHSFHTATDSEVILEAYRAWGVDCLKRLNGMFAFALYDIRNRQLFLARDRAGEKPLYYSHNAGRLLVGSELKALMQAPGYVREIDNDALQYYLAYGYVPGELCILKHTAKLPQAHALTLNVRTGALRTWRYWDLPAPEVATAATAEDLANELQTLLFDSVRLRLIADVPVGILLSGGIDSSLVTAAASQVSQGKVRTYTVTFPGHGSYDESEHARKVAAHFGTAHTELIAEPATVDLLPKLAAQFDEPLADSSLVPTYLVSRLIRQHATVAVGGDGGDELFGGYLHYSSLQSRADGLRSVPRPLLAVLRTFAARALPPGVRGRNYLLGLSADTSEAISQNGTYFDEYTARRLVCRNGDGNADWQPARWKAGLSGNAKTVIARATETDFRSYLVDDVLTKVDRASMLTSLEVRAPWLDPRIIEFAFSRVPDSLRATKAARKILPRMLARKLLPPDLDLTRKQGFSIPLHDWFQGKWGNYMEEVLRQADPAVFDQRTIEQLIIGQRKGRTNSHRIFALTMFELWRRHYRVSVNEAVPAAGG